MNFENLLGKVGPAHTLDTRRFPSQSYAVRCLPDKQTQAARLEALRYKWRYKGSPLLAWRVMQRLGDFGRRYFFNPMPGMRIWW